MLWSQLKKKSRGLWSPCPTREADSTKGMWPGPSSHHPQNIMRQPWKGQGNKTSPFCFHVGLCGRHIPASLCNQRAENWFHLLRMEIYGWTPRVGTRSSDCWFFKKNEKSCYRSRTALFCLLILSLYAVCCLLFPSTWWGSSLSPQQQMSPWKKGKRGNYVQ